MIHKKNTKIKKTKKSVQKKQAAILLSTKISGTSIAHGHEPYHHHGVSHNNKIDDKSKSLIMYIGIGVIMTIIVIVWIINLRQTLGPNAFSLSAPETKGSADFSELRDDLNQTLSDVKNEIKKIEEKAKENQSPTSTPTFIPTSTIVPTMTVTPTSTVMPSTTPTFKSITPTSTNNSKILNTLPN